MNRAWLAVLVSLVFLGASAWAQATVTIDNGPYTINPANDLDVNFTLTDSSFIFLSDLYSFNFYLSDDSNFDAGDVNMHSTTAFLEGCDEGDINTTGMICSTTFSTSGPADANKFVIIEAMKDTNGTISSVYANSAITFDSTNPVITGPVFDTNIASGTWSTVATTMTATCNETPCTLEYSLGGGTFAALPGAGVLFSNENGLVVIRATDAVGNVADTNASPFDLKVDTTVPTGSITSNPVPSGNYITDATPEFTLTASDAGSGINGSTFSFKIDDVNQSITFTTSPVVYTPSALSEGPHTSTLNVTDAAGNVMTQVSFAFNVDSVAPAVPGNFHSTNRDDTIIDLAWNSVTDATSGLSEYRIYRSTTTTAPTSPTTTIQAGTTTLHNTGLSSCTEYKYWIQSVDNAGNVSTLPSAPMVAETTSGCSNGNNSNNNSNNNGGGGGNNGGGGGGGACVVTFDVPASVYAGETVTAKVSGNDYANGYFRVTPAGKATVPIKQTGATADEWEGPFTVPNSIGTSLKFVFGTDSCTASTTRVVKDPSTKAAPSAPTTPSNTPSNSGELDDEPVLPEAATLSFAMENLLAMISGAGFNADNPQMKIDAENAIIEWNIVPTLKVVPVEGENGKYTVQMIFVFQNTGNKGTVKLVQDIPKAFSNTADGIDSSMTMTVLKDDPLIQFEISDLTDGQIVEIVLTAKETLSFAAASAKMEALKVTTLNPPLLFSSGVGKPAAAKESDDSSSMISGLVGFVGNTGPLVLGFLLIVGLIFVSVRVVRGSVEGSENPILRSSSGVRNTGRSAPVRTTPVRGKNAWKSGEVRIDD